MSTTYDSFVRDRLPPSQAQPEFLFDLPELDYPERLNAAAELIDTGDPDAAAVLNAQGNWSYGQLRDMSDRIARLLVEEEGLVPGNRVLLRAANKPMLVACWFAVMKTGGIAVAFVPRPGPSGDAAVVGEMSVA